jgi:rubrerythrin
MNLNTVDIIKQKLLDTQENVRDFMEYAEKIEDSDVNKIFKEFATDEAMHGQKLQSLLAKLDSSSNGKNGIDDNIK